MQTLRLIFNLFILCSMCFACQQKPTETATVKTTTKPSITNELHRPHFHFTPPEKWMNDPNGMVFYEGEYHLFYQHYPDSTVWGPMHWGHAISTNLVTWEHLPIALYPDELGYIFSGSAVIDWKNTSGFGKDGQPPMIAIFTHHDPKGEKSGSNTFQYQSIAYSNDRGRTWTKYKDNPVIPNPGIRDFRDPKVIWDDDSKQWVMVFAAQDHVKFYGSPNLRNWTFLSDFGKEWGTHAGVWECPDLFPMIVKGKGVKKWVLLQSLNPGGPNGGSGTQYFVGDFDGKNFVLDESFKTDLQKDTAIWLDYGRDNYAGVTWSDIPAADGRRLFMGWMSNWDYAQVVPTGNWRSAMTIARSLVLKETYLGYRLFSEPVKEMITLTKNTTTFTFDNAVKSLQHIAANKKIVGKVTLKFSVPEDAKGEVTLQLSNSKGEQYAIGYLPESKQFFSNRKKAGRIAFSKKFAVERHYAPRASKSTVIEMEAFFDVASVELFADKGWTVLTDIFFPNEDFNQLDLQVVDIRGFELHEGQIEWYE
ncbi:MAG: glycoside hydrolase family 32 protein [Bacteroidota bacterium]